MLLKDRLGALAGLEAVVVGRSNIVGKPMARLLLREHCTVTVAHSRTRDLAEVVRRADIVVAAVGRPEMIKGDWLKPGATVIDSASAASPTPRGDVDSLGLQARAITPVPAGRPMTSPCFSQPSPPYAPRRARAAEGCDNSSLSLRHLLW